MNKKGLLLLSVLIISFVLSGCWNSRELNTLGISLIMGFDLEENGDILLTAEVIDPEPSTKGLGELETSYVQGRGKTIVDAGRDITLKFDRALFGSHSRVFIFGEEIGKSEIIEYMDFFKRYDEPRETTYLLIAKDSKAYEIMGIAAGIEDVPANYVTQLVENKKVNGKTVDVDILDFMKYYYEEGSQPVVGVIERKTRNEIKRVDVSQPKKPYELSVEGATVFKEGMIVGYLNGNETRGFNFITGEIKGGLIQFPTPHIDADEHTLPTPKAECEIGDSKNMNYEATLVEIIKSKTKRDVEVKDGKIIFKIKVVLKGSVAEVVGDIGISRKAVIESLEEACSEEVKNEMEKVINKAQKEFKVDIFKSASLFHRKYPEKWDEIKDDWGDIFPETEFQVEVETSILRTGLTNTPTIKVKGE